MADSGRMAGRWGAFEVDGGLCGDLEALGEPGLVLKAMGMLSVRELFKLRCVCRSWYDAVLSPCFTRHYKQPVPEEPWAVLTVRVDEETVRGMELWRPLHGPSSRREISGFPSLKGLCSSGGLVCGFRDSQLVVVNPMTGELKTLPPFDPVPKSFVIDARMETRTDSSYKLAVLVALGDYAGDERICVQEYESTTCSWRLGSVFSPDKKMEDRNHQSQPLLGSTCYYDCFNAFYFLMVYDHESRAWSYVHLWDPCYCEILNSPFKYQDKYYCASLLTVEESDEEFGDYPVIGAGIWEFQKGVLYDRDLELVTQFLNEDSGNPVAVQNQENLDVTVMVVEDTVVMSTWHSSFGALSPVAYNFARDEWYTSVDKRGMKEDVDIACNYTFVPSLTARP